MRIASVAFSSAASVANSLAMPASKSQRSPRSSARAALSVSIRAAVTRVTMSASLSAIAWCSCSGLPKVRRSWL